MADVIQYVYEHGQTFDAWGEYYHQEKWDEAFAACGVDPDFYVCRTREEDEIFPWDFIHAGVTKDFLLREWHRAKEETVTPNCRMQCAGCGARSYKGGVCCEDKN